MCFSSISSWKCESLGFAMFKKERLKTHRIRMYAIYGNIYHQYTPVMLASIYHTTGSVMGNGAQCSFSHAIRKSRAFLDVTRHAQAQSICGQSAWDVLFYVQTPSKIDQIRVLVFMLCLCYVYVMFMLCLINLYFQKLFQTFCVYVDSALSLFDPFCNNVQNWTGSQSRDRSD